MNLRKNLDTTQGHPSYLQHRNILIWPFFCNLRSFPSPVCDFIGDAQSLSAPCESYAQPEFMTNGARNAAFESEKSAVA